MRKLFLSILLLTVINTIKGQCPSNIVLTGITTGIQNSESSDNIKATVVISKTGKAIYHAGRQMLFSSSFVATSGCTLHAYIADCSGTFESKQQINQENDNLKEFVRMQIAPNPSSGIYNISFEEIRDGTIEVTDLMGYPLYNSDFKQSRDFELNIQDKPKGVYIVRIKFDNQIVVGKIVKE